MDYYQKYIKYKTKYLELKTQIYGGKVGATCQADDGCDANKEYCDKETKKCTSRKKNDATCTRDGECAEKYHCSNENADYALQSVGKGYVCTKLK